MDGCFMVQIYGKQVIKEKKSVNTKKAGRARAAARCNVPLAGKSIKVSNLTYITLSHSYSHRHTVTVP